jgi:phosphotransferase system enzyme I (PtsI)
MVILQGKSVFGGVAIGKIQFFKRNEIQIKRRHVDDPEAEIRRFRTAKEKALSELQQLYDKALADVGEANAMIFEAHQLMLEDPDYNDSVENIINTQKVNAEYAIGVTSDNYAAIFEAMDDAYMQGRAADVKDVSNRLLSQFAKKQNASFEMTEQVIIAADDLAPSETVQLDKDKVLSFITMEGSANSHTAILARTMNIPAVIGIGDTLTPKYDGRLAIVDGQEGKIYIDPDEEILVAMRKKQAVEQEQRELLETLKGKENVTRSGQKINLYANIANVSDVGAALRNDAGGIGLFRSEFLYLENETYPTEEQQFAAYRQVAEMMAGKRVIIRTLDIGADKQVGYFNLEKEDNPAMGFRAIRICLTRPELFKTQLRAIFRASAYGQIAIMFPMIISVSEVRRIKEIMDEVKTGLRADGIAFSDQIETGIMIETPAAVMISRELAKEVDFFSVGTNDLTQYTLAIDRQNRNLDSFYDSHHPAVLSMIQMAAENAHAEGKWIGICGELAADLSLTERFLQMNIDELSVAPGMILPLRKKIREL